HRRAVTLILTFSRSTGRRDQRNGNLKSLKRISHRHVNKLSVSTWIARGNGVTGEEDAVPGGQNQVVGDLPIDQCVGFPAKISLVIRRFVDRRVALEFAESVHISADLQTVESFGMGERK